MSRAGQAAFLLEIGTEELPPKALRDLSEALGAGVGAGLQAASLEYRDLEVFATPRRLAVRVSGLSTEQPAQQVEKRGPPVSIAFDAHGLPTRAAEAFAKSCAVELAALERLETPKGTWLVYRAELPGQPAVRLLEGIVLEAVARLPIPRRMRWGSGDTEFVRPVHWVVMLLGDEVVPAAVLGHPAERSTRGHRYHALGAIDLRHPEEYEHKLLAHKVIAAFDTRRARVQEITEAGALALGGSPVASPALWDEVTALVEWPVAIEGRFDPEFLRLPEEVLVATLQAHQRYFPVRGPDGALLPAFIAISNLESHAPERVREGNERVVRPRLADAAFFYDQDCARSLASRLPDLENVVFQHGLGSLADKSRRVAGLAQWLAPLLGADALLAERAALLAKTDLLTQMVGEFPELQGRMGYYYARHDGESDKLAVALEEQYLPRHAGDRLPETPLGRALAIADRLDTLAGIFALGKRPTGNKDPFGLRRAALGLLRVLIEGRVDLDLPAGLARAVAAQPRAAAPELAGEIAEFIVDRLRAYSLEGLAPGLPGGSLTAEMFEAVRARRPASPLDFHARLLAVRAFTDLPEAESLASANKRIANILRGTGTEAAAPAVDAGLFESPAERHLLAAIERVASDHAARVARRDYDAALRSLAGLKDTVDHFFDEVLVMTEDARLRQNRLALLHRLRELFLDVADLSCIPAS